VRLLERRGLGPQADFEEADSLSRDQPLLAELYNASVQGRIAVGPQVGNYLLTDGIPAEQGKSGSMTGPRCANVLGFSLHANVCIPVKARRQLEICAVMLPVRRWPRNGFQFFLTAVCCIDSGTNGATEQHRLYSNRLILSGNLLHWYLHHGLICEISGDIFSCLPLAIEYRAILFRRIRIDRLCLL